MPNNLVWSGTAIPIFTVIWKETQPWIWPSFSSEPYWEDLPIRFLDRRPAALQLRTTTQFLMYSVTVGCDIFIYVQSMAPLNATGCSKSPQSKMEMAVCHPCPQNDVWFASLKIKGTRHNGGRFRAIKMATQGIHYDIKVYRR